MISFMLDTNICIYIIKKKPDHVLERLKNSPVSKIGISTIVISELEYGAERSSRPDRNRIALIEFLAPFEILSYNDMAARRYGGVRAHLERQGTPIGSMDMLIAAHALALDCTLITNNEREFRRVPSLKIENWAK